MFKLNPVFRTDAYKLSHKKFMTNGTTFVQANLTPRSFRLAHPSVKKVVVFGTQRMVIKLKEMWDENFFKKDKQEVMNEIERIFKPYLGMGTDALEHFGQLHDWGCLPINIRGIQEGSLVDEKTPVLFIENNHPAFAWLVTYLETWISTEMWLPITSATTAYHMRKMVNKFAMETTGSTAGTEWQLHDFSYRGMGPDEAGASGAGFLLSSYGTDTIPAILELEYYYGADVEKELIAASVPATEHSVTCIGIAVDGELETMRRWITKDYPTGIVSIVSDTLDFWKVITEYATILKDDILNRQVNELGLAKTVFRPDSGCPVKVLTGYELNEYALINGKYFTTCGKELSEAEVKGAVECLWDIFGGTENELGYKVLNERVGLIYGDSITYERANEILQRLMKKGFASTNVVFGIGSYTMRYVTRDTLGMAIKVTYAEVGGVSYPVAKDPVTDNGIKKSAKGYLDVIEKDGVLTLVEYDSTEQWRYATEDCSATVCFFDDGIVLSHTTLKEIRERLWE